MRTGLVSIASDDTLNTPYVFRIRGGPVPAVNNASGATGVSLSSATLNGILTDGGSAAATAKIYWGPADGMANDGAWAYSTNVAGPVSEGIPFSCNITIPSPVFGAPYYYRCFVSNAFGTGWSTNAAIFLTTRPVGGITLTVTNGMDLWLDANAANTMNLSGSTVNVWSNKLGGGAKASTMSGSPILTNGIGGLPTVYFNTSTRMNDGVNHSTPVTILYVSRETGVANGRVLGGGNNWIMGYYGGSRNSFHYDSW